MMSMFVSLSVCPMIHSDISKTTLPNFTVFSLYVDCGCVCFSSGGVAICHVFPDDVMFSHNGPYNMEHRESEEGTA